jgi:hypothetical protein
LLLLHLHRLARWLRPLLKICRIVGFGAVIVVVLLLLRKDASTSALSLALGMSLWALMLDAFIRLFQTIPPPVLPHDSFMERFVTRLRLALYHVLAVSVVLLAVALLAMSLKLVSASLR